MKFKFIKTRNPEYVQECMLRWEVLHKPLGVPPDDPSLFPKEENNSVHLVAVEGKEVVGCLIFHPTTEIEGEIEPMSVSETYKGMRFGRKFVHALERALIKMGIQEVVLFAREEAISFYHHLGFHVGGEKIVKFGVAHVAMKKSLAPAA
jgi:ribosomal protein S18 acetylase RimI-like enzyme